MLKLRPWHGLVAVNAVVLAVLAIWTTSQSQAQAPAAVQDVIRARVIELVNDQGETRAQLHVAENGAGELRLRNGAGDIRVKFGATDDGAVLLMMDGTSQPAIRLASDNETPGLRIVGPRGAEGAVIP